MLAWLPALIELINRILKMFEQPVQSKVDDLEGKVHAEQEEFKKTGRPKW